MPQSNKLSSLGTIRSFLKEGSCSGALCTVLNRAYQHLLEQEEFATMLFAGGIMQHGYQCGLLWGARRRNSRTLAGHTRRPDLFYDE